MNKTKRLKKSRKCGGSAGKHSNYPTLKQVMQLKTYLEHIKAAELESAKLHKAEIAAIEKEIEQSHKTYKAEIAAITRQLEILEAGPIPQPPPLNRYNNPPDPHTNYHTFFGKKLKKVENKFKNGLNQINNEEERRRKKKTYPNYYMKAHENIENQYKEHLAKK